MNSVAQRLKDTFQQIEKEEPDMFKQLLNKKKCADILVQELEAHVNKYKLIKEIPDQILFHKEYLPQLAKWQIATTYLITIEQQIFIGTPKQKIILRFTLTLLKTYYI